MQQRQAERQNIAAHKVCENDVLWNGSDNKIKRAINTVTVKSFNFNIIHSLSHKLKPSNNHKIAT